MMRNKKRNALVLIIGLFTAVASTAVYPGTGRAEKVESSLPDGIFAIIDGEEISQDAFDSFFARYMQEKLYHGATQQTPEGIRGGMAEALEALIDQRLLAHEANRRGLVGNPEAVEASLEEYEARYKDNDAWPEIKELWPALREELLEETKVEALKVSIREVPDPSDGVLNAYYYENLNLFTEPEKVDLSVLLLGVAATAESSEWKEALQKAKEIYSVLETGSEFSDLTREYSTHESAEAGGRLGLVHNGMLSQPAQEAVNKLQAGMVSPPVRVLDGFALFKLHERLSPQVHDFAEVRERAQMLYLRENADRQWSEFIAKLRSGVSVVVDDSL